MVRIKNRYLLVHILYPEPSKPDAGPKSHTTGNKPPDLLQFHSPSSDDLTPQVLAGFIKDQVQYMYGEYGLGLVASSLVVKYFSPATSTIIIRCARAQYRLVWSALTFITRLPKTSNQPRPRPCVMQVVRVSGTIKKAEEEAIRRARDAILKAKREAGEGTLDGLMGLLNAEEELGKTNAAVNTGSDDDDDFDPAMASGEE